MKKSILFLIAALILVNFTGCSGENGQDSAMSTTGTIDGTIIDGDSGEPLSGRVYVVDASGKVHLSKDGISYERPQFIKRAGDSGKHFTTIGNEFTVKVPAGLTRIIVERGKEYYTAEEEVTVEAGKTVDQTFRLFRWIDMNAKGWYSGDTHAHRPLDDMAALMTAEDLNVALPQTVWGQKRADDLDAWLGKAGGDGAVAIDGTHIFSVLSHEIERVKNSAVLFHGTGKTILPIAEVEESGLPNMTLIAKAREINGIVEAEKPWWPESHIDIATGKADIVGILNNHLCYNGFLPEHPRKRTEYRKDYRDGDKGYVDYCLDLYYAYLNCGFRVMPTAGSASGVLPNPLGHNRVYVKVDDDFSYDSWLAGLKAGRSFVTNGPMLLMTVKGSDPGSTVKASRGMVSVACEIHSAKPIEKLEIIRNGEVVLTLQPEMKDNTAVAEANIPFDKSGWIAARCFESNDKTVRFAHTAPVFVDVPGYPFVPDRDAASYFLKKTKSLIVRAETGEYPSDEARDAAMGVYMGAEDLFEQLIFIALKKKTD